MEVGRAVGEAPEALGAGGGVEPELDVREGVVEACGGRREDRLRPGRGRGYAHHAGAPGTHGADGLVGGLELAQDAAAPSAVRRTPCGRRSNSFPPKRCSRRAMSRVSVGWVMARRSAVAAIFPVSATGLVLVDTGTGTETALADGAALVLDDPANGSWGLVASVAPEAQVGSVVLALTGANTGIAARDNAAPYSLHGDEDGTVTGAGLPAGSYTLKATAYAEADGAGAELGTLSVSFSVAASEVVDPDALTASFEGVPEVHDGSSPFTFRVRFSQEPRVSYSVLRDESFAVTGGDVDNARRVDGRNDLREIHIEPEGWDDVRVTLAGGRACETEGAICTADGKVLANTAVATVPGPLALSVADALPAFLRVSCLDPAGP